jgi:tight adherence protein B
VTAALVGAALGLGLLLMVSPWFWRRRETSARRSAIRDTLAAAGMANISPAGLAVVSIFAAGIAGLIALAVTGVPVVAAIAAVFLGLVPLSVVRARARARQRQHRRLWPDVVDHLVSAVRAGMSLPEAISALGTAGPEALRPAFGEFERNYQTRSNLAQGLDRLKQSLADPTADRIIETLRMAREVGGSQLPSVLRSLSEFLRQDLAVRSEVEARQSWLINAARLGVAAPWVVLLLLGSRPEAVVAYNTPAGTALIVTGAVLSVIAYRLMLAIGRLPEQRRWFA